MPPAQVNYDDPFHWWGPQWDPVPRFDIAHLLRSGTLEVSDAAILWAALARRRSLVVISGPSRLGKTTLLSALLPFLPASTRKIHLRGSFETFAFLCDPMVEPANSALLINEISPHLPIYLWGSAVSQALAAAERGYALLATAHGTSVAEFVGSLTGCPLRIPASRIAALETVVLLEEDAVPPSSRKVTGIWQLDPGRDGLSITTLSRRSNDISRRPNQTTKPTTIPSWSSPSEIAARHELLAALRDGETDILPENPEMPPYTPGDSPLCHVP